MILIAESGTSKTDWRMVGSREFQLQTKGMNPYFLEDTVLEQLVMEAFSDIQRESTQSIYFYGAGCGTPTTQARMQTVLERAFPFAEEISVLDDMTAAVRATCGKKQGIVGILGTGAGAAVGNRGKCQAQRLGNGIWLGDEGSGADLGKTLIIAYLEDRLPKTLQQAYESRYPFRRAEILQQVYRNEQPSVFLAQFAPWLHEQRTHPFIHKLLEERFTLFIEKNLLHFSKKTHQPVHMVGSIAYHFQEEIRAVGKPFHINWGQFLKSPIEALVDYHA